MVQQKQFVNTGVVSILTSTYFKHPK